MVRVFLKGGVWKNSEDEILKAAIQKYGKQQWARVASLLNRKTAKQAKARWHEWLDPAIRKTEWSRPEEEQLMKLAQLFPAQWKTIAPLVGRTATQCQEHYEALLDQQATAATGSDGTTAAAASASAALRPGQIDAHPEGKPAKPDPVDMDEDELEMLQEARARLANTQGKKAKRKQRERLLQQAKRLADLQKRRELKQAGLLSTAARKKSSKRKNEIDFGVEIPFYKPAPAGFHDVSTEKARSEALRLQRASHVDLQKVNESQYRTRDREAEQARKREEGRLRMLQASNETYQTSKSSQWAESVSETELPASIRRGQLQLPAPIQELQQQAKMSRTGYPQLAQGSAATQTLVSDDTQRPLPTPMRASMAMNATPMTHEALVRQANQWRRDERGPTPLIVSQEQYQQYNDQDGDDETDWNDRKLPAKVSAGHGGAAAATSDDHSVGASTFATNATASMATANATATAQSMLIRDLARNQRRAAKRARAELEDALKALPAPLFEYELAIPQSNENTSMDMNSSSTVSWGQEEDAADVQAAILERQREEADRRYRARSSVMKRLHELPRPPVQGLSRYHLQEPGSSSNNTAIKSISDEMLSLVKHDAKSFPMESSSMSDTGVKRKKKKRSIQDMQTSMENLSDDRTVVALEVFSEPDLASAQSLIQAELELVLDEKINIILNDGNNAILSRDDARAFLLDETIKASLEGAAAAATHMVYLPDDRGWVESATEQDVIDSLRYEIQVLQEATASLKKKNDKTAAKLAVTNGGYVKRAEKLESEMAQLAEELQTANQEEAVYRVRQLNEMQGGTDRVEHWNRQIKALRLAEAALQKQFGALRMEKRRRILAAKSATATSSELSTLPHESQLAR